MKREDKIRVLTAIQEGQITREDLQPHKRYWFREQSEGVFEFEGKVYTMEDIERIIVQSEAKHQRRLNLFRVVNDHPCIIIQHLPLLPVKTIQEPEPELKKEPVEFEEPEEQPIEEAEFTVEDPPEEPKEPIKPEVMPR